LAACHSVQVRVYLIAQMAELEEEETIKDQMKNEKNDLEIRRDV
jgi:hypothetical protein